MRAPLLVLASVIAGVVACSSGSSDPSPPTVSDNPPTSGTGDVPPENPPAVTPPGTTPGGADWTPPVVATTSAACGTAKPVANGVDYTTPSGRTFHVWGPTGYDKTKTYPVVFMWHGVQADGPSFQDWFSMEQYTNNEAFVVYADAIKGLWDVSGDRDLLFFDEMVKQMGETYCIDPSHVYAFGFSYGAFFAHHLGCNRAGFVRAIAAGEGGFGGSSASCGRLPVFITNRTADTNEPVSHGKGAESTWVGLDVCGTDTSNDASMNCTVHGSCKNPGGTVTFCEDTSDMSGIDGYDPSWDHTVRENYRAYAWTWFKKQ